MMSPLRAGSLAAPLRLGTPQGVDLSLEKFNLSEATSTEEQSLKSGIGGATSNVPIAKAFWSELTGESQHEALSADDKKLFRDVFNPYISDRHNEGDAFLPPATRQGHIQTLKTLIGEEESVRTQRRSEFFSAHFVTESPGMLFPASWTAAFKGADVGGLPQRTKLVEKPQYLKHPTVLKAVQSEKPVFDKETEEGIRWRIYRLGSLEVRTTQDPFGEESVGAVLSIGGTATPGPAAAKAVSKTDKITKATEYVEWSREDRSRRSSYVLLQTEAGHTIVTEKLADGSVTWQENHDDVDFRSSLAKVVRTSDCSKSTATVADMQLLREQRAGKSASHASRSQCKKYAQSAYCKAAGELVPNSSGFFHQRRVAVYRGAW